MVPMSAGLYAWLVRSLVYVVSQLRVRLRVSGVRTEDWRRDRGRSLFFCAQFAWVKVGWGGVGHGREM